MFRPQISRDYRSSLIARIARLDRLLLSMRQRRDEISEMQRKMLVTENKLAKVIVGINSGCLIGQSSEENASASNKIVEKTEEFDASIQSAISKCNNITQRIERELDLAREQLRIASLRN